jgi:hypothetical protein
MPFPRLIVTSTVLSVWAPDLALNMSPHWTTYNCTLTLTFSPRQSLSLHPWPTHQLDPLLPWAVSSSKRLGTAYKDHMGVTPLNTVNLAGLLWQPLMWSHQTAGSIGIRPEHWHNHTLRAKTTTCYDAQFEANKSSQKRSTVRNSNFYDILF